MKKILISAISTTFLALSANAITYEYPYLYKEPRALGMGGAYVAVGGTGSSIFYNPAGLGKINKKAGWEVDILNINIAYGKNSKSFIDDISNALDATDGEYVTPADGDDGDDQLVALNETIKKYLGENLHFSVNDFSSVSKKFDRLAFTIGIIASVTSDAIPHQGFGVEGVIEEHLNIDRGLGLGFAYDFNNVLNGNINVGLSAKYIQRTAVNHYFTTRELVEHNDNLGDYVLDTVAKDGSSFGFDFGVIYNTDRFSFMPVSVGFSILNIGDMDFGEAGKIPMTMNLGLALYPKIPIFDWTIAIDYVDLTQNFDDTDKKKRIRAGLEVKLWDNKWTTLALRGGLYQSHFSGGIDFRLTLFRVAFTTYAEEVGAYAGQKSDRRYVLTLGFGW